MEREATEVLLEMLSKETESKSKTVILDLLKDIGKNQIAVISEHLSDSRWLFVRDIINIISEIKSDKAVVSLQKAVENKNIKIRQEVVKCLIPDPGVKKPLVSWKVLKRRGHTIKLMAIGGFTEIKGISTEDTKASHNVPL